jgi:hypothetical protein
MTRSSPLRLAFAALALAAAATSALVVAPVAHSDEGPAAINPDQRTYWRNTAAELRARVAAAAIREQAATAAYSRMLTRRYPAGDAKLAIIDERDTALRDLAEARAEVKTFKEQARAAGVPDRWIDPDGTPPPWWVDPDS